MGKTMTARQLIQNLLNLDDLDSEVVFVNQKTLEKTVFIDSEEVETENNGTVVNLIAYDPSL